MRGINLLHPDLQKLATQFVINCKKASVNIILLDTYRTKAEQDAIPKANTNAKYPHSMHNWHLAFDFCIKTPKGGASFDYNADYDKDKKKDFAEAIAIGEKLGLFSGSRFTTVKGDFGHMELRKFGINPTALIKKYGTPEKFAKTFKK